MQVILGSTGTIGFELAKALPEYTDKIRLVSRNPEKVNDSDELLSADLTNYDATLKAVEGAETAYLTVGLPYNAKIWQEQWPVIMKNVIKACKATGVKLVYFDNMYMYDCSSLDPMKEDHPINPPSKKGKVRGQIAQMLLDEMSKGSITAMIVRAADFYGPSAVKTSMLAETVIKPLSKGKKAMLMAGDSFKHSYTHTRDAGIATAMLGNTDDAYGQVWHLPTAGDPPTGKQMVELIAGEFGVKPKYMVISKFMVRLIGLFVPVMREQLEMMYQFDRDYVFNSDKFEKRFNFRPTPYKKGIEETIRENFKK